VLEPMRHNCPRIVLIGAEAARTLQDRIVELGIAGGAVYDALVGAAAVEHGVPLVSRDVAL
jgi:toxin FitB